MKLQADNLTIGYHQDCAIYSGISFSVASPQTVLLLGENGIGKSTLLRTLAGLQKPLNGKISLDDIDISTISSSERAHKISVVLTDKVQVDKMTARNFVSIGRLPYTGLLGLLSESDEEIVEIALEQTGIANLSNRYFNQLSDGERQKVMIARALAQETPVILLDEPTAFLDYKARKNILHMLRNISENMNKSIIISTHDIESAIPYATSVWFMKRSQPFREVPADLSTVTALL